MNENGIDEPVEQQEAAAEDAGVVNVDEYEIPVLEDDTDDRYPAFVAGSTLIVRLEEAGELKIPLRLSYNQIKRLRETVDQDADELDQLIVILEMFGDEKLLDTLTNIDLADALAVAILYFRAWRQRTKVSLGKLRGSSRQ